VGLLPALARRVRIAAPLEHRDFRRLWSGLVTSLVGDGIFLVAVAWQAYTVSNHPSALAGVGLAASIPQLALLLVGGAVSDRLPRRTVLLSADVSRAAAVGALAVLDATGALHLWHLWAVAFVIGAATAFASPAFDAIVPELVPEESLLQANGLDQFLRPLTLRLLGPAIGGVVVVVGGTSTAFGIDAASFAFSAWCISRLRASRPVPEGQPSLWEDMRSGLSYVRGEPWLWGTFVAATFTYLLFLGPTEVLLPYLVKHSLHGSARSLGLVLGLGGLGSVLAAAGTGQREGVRRPITFMYVTWTLATLLVAGYGVASRQWELAGIAFAIGALEAAGTVVWATLKARLVPGDMLGRVSSIDWFVSTALMPVSYALTPLAAGALGVRATFFLAGFVGSAVTFGFLFLPGMRRNDRPAWAGTPAAPPAVSVLVEIPVGAGS
jgi:MFS family permease